MATIRSKKLCNASNANVFFDKLVQGSAVSRDVVINNEKKKEVILTEDRRIYFDNNFSVRFYEYDGGFHMSLDILTLADRKAIKEHRESKPEVTDL